MPRYNWYMALLLSSSPVVVRCKGILFDMDGILISSIGSVERSWTRWAEMRGVDPVSTCRIAHGRRAIETVHDLRPDLDSAAELKVIEDIEIADHDGLSVLPGVMDLLAALPKDRWTVVTSATERLARARLAEAGIPVPDRMVTADQVTQGKPHPAPFLLGAAILGFKPEECVVFEDSSSGAQAGRAAGCVVVATPFSHPIETLEAANYLVPDLTVVSVATLPGDEGLEIRFTTLSRRG
jgi:mannitol-1-/sugar-/sorbitol-6-phosphatase